MTLKAGKDFLVDAAAAAQRIDNATRLRNLSKVLVTEEAPGEDDTPELILLDLKKLTPKQMLQNYADHRADMTTSHFDTGGERLVFYKGEWTIWSGYPGSGKTTNLRQIVCHLLKSGEHVFAFSGEDDPENYIIDLCATAAGVEFPSETQLCWFLDTFQDKLKVWGIIGIARHKQLLATIRKLADEGQCTHAIIDSLMCLDIEEGDNEGMRQFANLINITARIKKIHIHLVAHPKKPQKNDQEPNMNDVAGSSNLIRLCWNIVYMRRGTPEMGLPGAGPMIVDILKQRTLGWLGQISGFFHKKMRQYNASMHANAPTRYLPNEAYVEAGFEEEPEFVPPAPAPVTPEENEHDERFL